MAAGSTTAAAPSRSDEPEAPLQQHTARPRQRSGDIAGPVADIDGGNEQPDPAAIGRRRPSLEPGAEHYTAFVGPPDEYDVMGATQLMLLVTLGLRDHHRVLDFGCGSLRAGRLLIAYLQRGNYHGLDAHSWLIDDAIERQLGRDLIAIKAPQFHIADDFQADRCGRGFDFILAQSIFSHAGADIVERSFDGFARALAKSGLALATFIHPGQMGVGEFAGSGWVYPDCVAHAPATISALAGRAGFCARALPWFHPRQTWYALARRPERLPAAELDPLLRGVILNVPAWAGSINTGSPSEEVAV